MHEHATGAVPGGPCADVDAQLLGSLVGAAAEGCAACRSRLLDRLVGEAATWARLIEWACESRADERGRLPREMTEQAAPGSEGEAFRMLARSFLSLGANRRYGEWAAMTVPERHAAARTALRYLTG